MKDSYIYVPLTLIIVALVFWIMPMVREIWSGVDRDVTETEPEWCLVEELPPSGGSWSQGDAGSHEYHVISTQSGFKVFQQCGKLE